jgi:hypothetical protein
MGMIDSGIDATTDAGATDSGTIEPEMFEASTWEIHYAAGTDGTNFYLAGVSTSPLGVYTSTCYSGPEQATVAPAGTSFTITPNPGCVETNGTPCIYCSLGCDSGTTVPVTRVGSSLTWQGSCGQYTVTMWGQ